MSEIRIVCIGKLKERYWREAQAEYIKRLNAFCRPVVIEKKEAVLPKGADAKQINQALVEEGESLLGACTGSVVALSPEGAALSSEQFSRQIKAMREAGNISFVVGGSHGLSQKVKDTARFIVSFSAMTMPHQLFRIVLIEQIYRALMIAERRTYHK